MRRSELFTKTSKTTPADETAKNAILLLQAGYVHKEMAGAYDFLPLGLRVIENIKQIVRSEMNAIGGQELIMTGLQRKEVWQTTGRWDNEIVDVWFKSTLKDGTEVGLGWSHEEPIVEMMKRHLSSYKDMPTAVYQFQTKLRNELRAKSGVMRGREFVMKDMYSFCVDSEQHDKFYNQTIEAYKRIYMRLGIGADTFVTFASGGAFTEFSHEFQTICEAGEDVIYLNRDRDIAVNEEVLDDDTLTKLGIKRDELEIVKTAEVGNIFNFGTQKSKDMDFGYSNERGERQFVHLGSYGVGVTRLVGVITEKLADDKGLVWPLNIAPFHVYLARLSDSQDVTRAADELYEHLQSVNVLVLYDDRDARPGEMFADAELIGIPYRIVVSERTVQAGQHELKKRTEADSQTMTADQIVDLLGKAVKG